MAAVRAAQLFSNASQIIVQTIMTDLHVEKERKQPVGNKVRPIIYEDNHSELIFNNDVVMEALANKIYAKCFKSGFATYYLSEC